jgi:hypothetical protein
MSVDIDAARVRRVLLADGWHAVEGSDSGSSFEVGTLTIRSGSQSDGGGASTEGLGYSFVDHHTRKTLAGPFQSIRALELD